MYPLWMRKMHNDVVKDENNGHYRMVHVLVKRSTQQCKVIPRLLARRVEMQPNKPNAIGAH